MSWLSEFGKSIHGEKPKVAEFRPTDPLKEMFNLLTGEVKNWDQITRLSDLYQTYLTGAYNKVIPGFSDILAQGGEDTQAVLEQAEPLIRGELPEDVKEQVYRSAAFKSLGAGTLFGPMGAALTARDLGRTSLDLMNQGTALAGEGGNAAQRWAGIAGSMMLDPAKQLLTPSWFSDFMVQQRAAQQATQQRKFNIEAAPDPAAVDRMNLAMGIIGMATGAGGMGGGLKATGSYGSLFGGGGGGDFGGGARGGWGGGMTGGAPMSAGGEGESTLWQRFMGAFGSNPAYTNVGGAGTGGYQFGWGQNPVGAMGAYNPNINYGGAPLDTYGVPAY
jgi:hypothetical protein